MAKRIFYVTQEELVVWLEQRGSVRELSRFSNTEEGVQAFSHYLAQDPDRRSRVLVDVIEEEFARDTIPRLPRRDRLDLLSRRMSRKYPRTPFRLAQVHPTTTSDGKQLVTYSAISNDELLNPWLGAVAEQQTPLTSITSVPLLVPGLLKKLGVTHDNVLLVSHHQGDKLRLVYFRDGNLSSARLSQSPPVDAPGYAESVVAEILRSRRYLERARLVPSGAPFNVCVLTDTATGERIAAHDKAQTLRLHQLSSAAVAAGLAMSAVPPSDRMEAAYVCVATRFSGAHDYAPPEVTHQSRLHRLRTVLTASMVAASLACALVTGVNLAVSASMRKSVATMQQQTQQMEQTFRREHEAYAPTLAGSNDMQAAVDTGDFILENRVAAGEVLLQLSRVLGRFPELRVDGVRWQVEVESSDESRPKGVTLMPLRGVTAELQGEVVPFDGNLRAAFDTIETFMAALREETAFVDVTAAEFPLDARLEASVSAELVGSGAQRAAPFRLRLRMPPGHKVTSDDAA